MHADAWFCRGRGHVVGQDYALAGSDDGGRAWAVVCDGCSGSPHTDVGARLVAHAAAEGLRRGAPEDVAAIGRRATVAAHLLGLDPTCCDATCLRLWTEPHAIVASLHGDGVVAAADRDGRLHVRTLEYPSGAPAYVAYAADADRNAAWRGAEADRWLVRVRHGGAPWRVEAEGRGVPPPMRFDPAETRWVAIGSDGWSAITESDGRGGRIAVAPDAAVAELTRFGSTTGHCVARRGQRFVARVAPARGWTPHDDLALAAVLSSREEAAA